MNLEKFYSKKIKLIDIYETKLGSDIVCDYLIIIFEDYSSFGIEVSSSGEGLSVVTEDQMLKEIKRTKIKYVKKDIRNSNDYILKINFNTSDIGEVCFFSLRLDKDIINVSLGVDSLVVVVTGVG